MKHHEWFYCARGKWAEINGDKKNHYKQFQNKLQQMGLLEKGLVWISLFISIAPMLGFMGTVIGMIQAFDKIAEVGDLSPAVVADGIKVALLTTVFGLIVAIILQIFYNYIISKIDGIVNKMEDASIALVDVMASNNVFK